MNCKIFDNFKFPIAGWIILIHEVLERFSFYGMKGILSIYLNLYLGFDDDVTTILYHLFVSLSYLSPILGAIVADNYLGRFRTILTIGIIYLFGHILMPLTAIKKNIPGPLIGMCILALGAGGIKSSVAAFGGDQIPKGNEKMIEKYFSLFYTAINLGAFVAQFVTPILRKDISCVDDQCYPLGFGVPAAVFLLTYLIFLAGKRTYNIVPTSKSVLSKFCHCIYLSIVKFCKKKEKIEKYDSVVDYAYPEYPVDFIADCKQSLKVMIVFLPIPVFWALYDQQGSRWTLQAKYMNGKIGNNYVMKPEQIQSFNALLIIGLIPIFDLIIYPFLERLNVLVKPTSRLVTSYVVTAVSFILAGILQIYLIKGQTVDFGILGSKIVTMNSLPNCQINLSNANQHWIINKRETEYLDLYPGFYELVISCPGIETRNQNLTLLKNEMKSALFHLNNKTGHIQININTVRIPEYKSYIKFWDPNNIFNNKSIKLMKGESIVTINEKYSIIDPGIYNVLCPNNSINQVRYCKKIIEITPGLVGIITIDSSDEIMLFKEFQSKLVHMLWQLPQYIVITCGEILCSITALSFAYNESPQSMKSLMQAVYLLTIFGGNLIVVIVAAGGRHLSQTFEFFLFAGFVLLAGFCNWILIRLFWISNKAAPKINETTEMK